MKDQSYSRRALAALLRKSDFKRAAAGDYDAFREAALDGAAQSVATKLAGANPLLKTAFRGKPVYKMRRLEDDLVLRKLTKNLLQFAPEAVPPSGREFIVSNLKHFLREGVPYRVYRFDIRSFYESVPQSELLKMVTDLNELSGQSKEQLANVLRHFSDLGGTGVPRGLAISSVLSDLLMKNFDYEVARKANVYFYARYVDDIVLVTNNLENDRSFVRELEAQLPGELLFNPAKFRTAVCHERAKPVDTPSPQFSFDFLGYEFTVFEPKKGASEKYRSVRIDISGNKRRKIKTRLLRAFREYSSSGDVTLLRQRVQFLTSNFSLVDMDTGRKKLAGIYYGYPQLTEGAIALKELDHFLRRLILKPRGRVFHAAGATVSNKEKRVLLSFSFEAGHRDRIFAPFAPQEIGEIQECWKYA